MTSKQLLAAIKAREKSVSKERDKIRDMVSKYNDLAESCDDALECLEDAANRLSELV